MKKELEKKLLGILEKNEALIVALTGEWGIGKTYFWNEFAKKIFENAKAFNVSPPPTCVFMNNKLPKKFKNKKVAYVSLFGKVTLKDIETDIILQLSKIFKLKNKLKNILGSSNFAGVDIASLTSIIPNSDFEGIIICFDDFERKSDKLDSKDILGLISQFKEEKNCKIVMIFNKDEIYKDENEIFSKFNDKIIDYELQYKPTVLDSYSLISPNLNCFKEYPLKYFEEKSINNIRVMKRVINALNDFKDFEYSLRNWPDIKNELADAIIGLAVVYTKNIKFDLGKFLEYYKEQFSLEEKKSDYDEKYKVVPNLLNIDNFATFVSKNILFENINYYFQNYTINKDELEEFIKNKQVDIKTNFLLKDIKKIDHNREWDLEYNDDNFKNDLFNELKKGGEVIIKFLSIDAYLFYVHEITRIDKSSQNNNSEIKEFFIKIFKEYLDLNYEEKSTSDIKFPIYLSAIGEYDIILKEYIKKKEAKFNKRGITKEYIIELLKKSRNEDLLDNGLETLKSIDNEIYKNLILKYPEVLECIINFYKSCIGSTISVTKKNVFDKIKEVLEEIADIKKEYKSKLTKIFNSSGIQRKIKK